MLNVPALFCIFKIICNSLFDICRHNLIACIWFNKMLLLQDEEEEIKLEINVLKRVSECAHTHEYRKALDHWRNKLMQMSLFILRSTRIIGI